MAIEYNFKYMPLVGKLSGKSMAEQTETAINEIASIVNDNTAQAEIINTLAEEANANSVEALEKATEALETSGRVYIKETSVIDLDNYCESQLIYVGNVGSTHLPLLSKGFLEVKTNDDKSQATQVFIDDTNKDVYVRTGAITATTVGDVTTYTASYGAWVRSATSADLAGYATTASPTFTGTVSAESIEASVGISAPNIDYFLWQPSTAYSVGDQVKTTSLPNNYVLVCTTAGTSGTTEPSYTGVSVGDTITDWNVGWLVSTNACTVSPAFTGTPTAPTPEPDDDSTKIATTEYVQAELSNYAPLTSVNPFLWQPTTEYTVGMQIKTISLPPQCILVCTTAGISGSTEPDYTGVSIGDTVTDGTCEWLVAENATTKYVDTAVNTKAADYLPLAGGTMTGSIKRSGWAVVAESEHPDGVIQLLSYSNDSQTADGASLNLFGKDHAGAGRFDLNASNGTTVYDFRGTSSGSLQWTGNEFAFTTANSSNHIRNYSDDSSIRIFGGSSDANGANLWLFGNSSAGAGRFDLYVRDGSTNRTLRGLPDGTLTWNGQSVQTSSDKRLKQDFSSVPDDVLEAWGKVNWQQFKYKADVERKGDSCRFHTGLVAQDVKEVGEENNVDLLKYGILCHDVQEATEKEEARDIWMIRYEEALSMEVIYLRSEIKKLREEIKALRTE